jgi:hypothetical protein
MNPQNQFVKSALEIERSSHNKHYQLTDESVSPVILGESNEDGIPREITIPALAKHAKFVDRDGNICDVALRTGRVYSEEPEAVHYETVVLVDILRAGQLPLSACPYTMQFGHYKPGPLVKPPAGFVPDSCPGAPDGCSHMKTVIAKRREEHLARFKRDQAKLEKQIGLSHESAKELFSTMTEGLGEVIGNAIANAKSARGGLRGTGEKDEK